MRKLIILLSFCPVWCLGQTIKIEAGTTIGSLNYQLNNQTYFNDYAVGYYATAGLDFLQKKRINLSSNIGVLKKVGSDMVTLTDALGNEIDKKRETRGIDYLTLNTFADYNFSERRLTPFIFGGARLDYAFNSILINKDRDKNRLTFGATAGAGVKYRLVEKVMIGFRGGYLINFNNIINTADRTFSAAAMFGYSLK